MLYIALACALFMASVMAHILFCRKMPGPGLHAKAFVLRAIFFLFIYAGSALCIAHARWLGVHSFWGMPFQFSAGIIYILLAPVYLCFYVLTQLTSPSKKILQTISRQGESSRADILASVQKEGFITTRLNDLCMSGCVELIEGRYVLTSEGRKIAATLDFMQLVLGRNRGG